MWLSRLTFPQLAVLLCVGLIALYGSVAVTIFEEYVVFGTRLSADGRFYVHDSTRGKAVFDTGTGRLVFKSEPGRELFFSPSATRIGQHRGGNVRIWNLSPAKIEGQLDVGDDARFVAFVDDNTLVVVKPTSFEHWSLSDKKRTVASHIQAGTANAFARDAAVSRDGRRVALGESRLGKAPDSAAGEWRYDIDLWEIGEPARHWELASNVKGSVSRLALSNDGNLLAADVSSGLQSSFIELWHLDSSAPPKLKRIGAIHAFAFSPDASELAFADWRWPRTSIRVWDIGRTTVTGISVKELDSSGRIDAMVYQPDGKGLVTSGSNGVVEWWKINPPTLVARVTGLALAPPVSQWWWATVAVYFVFLAVAWSKQTGLATQLTTGMDGARTSNRAGLLASAAWSLINAGALLYDKYGQNTLAFPDTRRTLLTILVISVAVVGTLAVVRVRRSGPASMLNLGLLIAVCVLVFDLYTVYIFAQDSA